MDNINTNPETTYSGGSAGERTKKFDGYLVTPSDYNYITARTVGQKSRLTEVLAKYSKMDKDARLRDEQRAYDRKVWEETESVQAQVDQMKKAGLNPDLMFGQIDPTGIQQHSPSSEAPLMQDTSRLVSKLPLLLYLLSLLLLQLSLAVLMRSVL